MLCVVLCAMLCHVLGVCMLRVMGVVDACICSRYYVVCIDVFMLNVCLKLFHVFV